MANRRFYPLLVTSLLAATAGAAELGEPRIASYRGQALVADIELSNLDDPAAPVSVRVANPDVYRGASLGVPPVLSALTLTVVKQGGKQFVHVTSNKPVDTEMLHLFLELGQGNARDVRLATLWLVPDPRPAPPPVAVVAPPAPVVLPAPAAPVVAAALPVAPKPEPVPLPLAAVSTGLPMSLRSAPPTSCKASASNNACAVLDTKNVALRAKLVGLEDKIKLLEATLSPMHSAVAATTVAAAALVKPAEAHVAPPAAPVAVVVKPKKPKPAAPAPSATPWLWISVAAAVGLAAIAAIVFLLLRRRRGKMPAAPKAPKGPGIMAGVKQRILARKGTPATE